MEWLKTSCKIKEISWINQFYHGEVTRLHGINIISPHPDTIAYSNSKLCGAWTPKFLFTWSFSETSTALSFVTILLSGQLSLQARSERVSCMFCLSLRITSYSGFITRWTRVILHEKFHWRALHKPYVVTKIWCVWNKTFLLGPLVWNKKFSCFIHFHSDSVSTPCF